MGKVTLPLQKIFYAFLLLCWVNIGKGQTPAAQNLKLADFAIWGGSASPDSYVSSQGVYIKIKASVQGNIGSNHLVEIKENFKLTGNIFSGNGVSLKPSAIITGNITANKKAANFTGNVISGDLRSDFKGNLTANGKIFIKTASGTDASFVRGQVAVPAPTATNYSGPLPTGGIIPDFTLPILPVMPTNTPFDDRVGTANITNTQNVVPGVYKKLALAGNKTITFKGPGNYIFNEVDNGTTSNKFVFDFNNTTSGNINIFIIKDARWGKLSVSTKNGNFPSRIYTEVHGNGAAFGGFAFDLQGPDVMHSGSYAWLGNIWAPNGSITVGNLKTQTIPHIIGALWSGIRVELKDNLVLSYQAPATSPNFIDPYYPPPPTGKVDATNNTIGAELFSLSQNPDPITSIPENEIFVLDNAGKVMIEVVSKTANDNELKTQLIDLGMTDILDNGPDVFIISGFFPIINLALLNGNSRIQHVRPLYPPISNTGLVTTQGDVTMRSNTVRSRFGLDGSGVKIGVISDSYDAKHGAQTDVDEGDLPGIKSNGQSNDNPEPVQVIEDLAQRGNDEGRAMLQIVHDIAPKAKLAFHTGFLSAGSFANAIAKLADNTLPGGRCDMIVDDLTYITEPFQRDGVVAQAVNNAVSQGVTYFSSAGNFGSKSYEAIFNGVTNATIIPTGQIHKFGPNATDIYQNINLKPGSYTIVLQWSDEFKSLGSLTGVQTDMDFYVVGANGYQLFGFNRSNLSGDPFEVCAFTVKEETNAKVMVVRAAGTSNVRFKYVFFRGDGTILDYQTGTSSIVGHPNADGAIAVGAMLYANIPPFTPVWPGVASFSSRGGTFTTINGNSFTQRNKPELIGPNGVNTTVNLGGPAFDDGDTYPNFFGTSAAAPHVAAVGALIIQGRKKFNLQTTVTPFQIRQQLQSSAGKFSYLAGNFSFEGGYGYVQADSAIAQIANARPIMSTLEAVPAGAQNGTQPFTVKITGKYLVSNTQIYVNNLPVTTTVSIDPATGVGTAMATVPAIPVGEDPPFQLSNPAKSPSGLDGGKSEALHFFSSGIRVLVKADNKSRKYGQENPTLTASVSIIIGLDTLDISQTSLTLTDLKLDDLTLATNATTFSSPRSYGISVARTVPLPSNDPLLSQYAFEFEPGTLTVERMTLKITPVTKIIKYGDDLSGITYSYEFDQNGVVSPHLLEEVKSLHKKYLADNGLVVVNGFNNQNSAIDLTNMSVLTSFQSVLNARKFIVENGQLKALTTSLDPSQIGEQRFIIDVSAQSLQNYELDPAQSTMVDASATTNARAFLSIKALTSGSAKAAVPGGELQPMVNGQLLAMVNGQLQALVNGQLKALVNGVYVDATDMTFQNGQLLALINGVWTPVTNGQLLAIVNGQQVTVELSILNGQLQAIVNGEVMTLVNGQLQAIVNGQLLAIVNGQLQALVNGQLTPLVNGQLMAIVNGELQPILNGQLLAIVNGQLMALVNGELEIVQDLSLLDGQLQAFVNGQLQALVNGQLKAMVNGVVTDVPTTSFNLVNGQLQAVVNGQLVAYVNGQLLALVNGQLQALVNGAAVSVESVIQLANGQLKAIVNGEYIPISNGQLQALVNGQLLAMVNGQLMAIVNGELTFVVFQNGQLQALVNGQLQALVNGQLQAIVNGELQAVNSYTIVNGQLQAIVNGETWVYPNGQLKALVNGQLQALVNNFDVSGPNNNAKTIVLVDENDINLQSGDVGGMFSMNMITGLDAGYQTLIPAAFVNENFEVTYGAGLVIITKKPLNVSADNQTKNAGEPNPPLIVSYNGFAFDEGPASLCQPIQFPSSPKTIDQLERSTTYTDVMINGASNAYYAAPGEVLTLTGSWSQDHFQNIIPGFIPYCPGCITQNYIGMSNDQFSGNVFDICYDVSGTFPHSGTINQTFTAPSRPGVYYITQQSTWWFSCYQFGHLLHDQIANDAIAVVIVNPSDGVTANTTATDSSPAGDYPIIVGGCYFNPNYRIVFQDGTLTVEGVISTRMMNNTRASQTQPMENTAISKITADKLYPNPATSILRLQLKDDVHTIKDIKIYNGVGQLTSPVTKRMNNGFYEINVSGLTRGVYIIEARTAVGIKTFKFIKM
jgi:hypothetical protein